MLYRIYKTLFFALLSILIWVGTVILSFFAGAVFMSMWEDKQKEKEKEKPSYSGQVRYRGMSIDTSTDEKPEPTEDSMYLTRLYNEDTSKNWMREFEANLMFLRSTENHVNDLLRRRGHVFLNDAYDLLGMKRTSHGAIAGWLFRDNVLIAFTPNYVQPGDDIVLEFDYHGIIYDRLVVLD